MEAEWQEVSLGSRLRFRAPVELTESAARGIDSNVAVLEGRNLTIMVEEGPFADPLTSYAHRPDARSAEETIGGRPARVVTFRLEDGRDFAAVHFGVGGEAPEAGGRKLTMSVTGKEESGGEVPLRIARSVELTDP